MRKLMLAALLVACNAHAVARRQFCLDSAHYAAMLVLDVHYGTPQFIAEQLSPSALTVSQARWLRMIETTLYQNPSHDAIVAMNDNALLRMVTSVDHAVRVQCLKSVDSKH